MRKKCKELLYFLHIYSIVIMLYAHVFQMKKTLLVQIILVITLIILGNLFWYLFISALKGTHLLTDSTFQIILSFVYPILVFSLYLSVILVMSLFIKKYLLLYLIIFLSMANYPFLLRKEIGSIIGEIAMVSALFFFVINFKKVHVIENKKTSLSDQLSLAFSNTSLIISITVAINFYTFYVHTLAETNVLITNKIIAKTLVPVAKIYLDDLHIQNPNEIFSAYLQRQSQESNLSLSQIKKQVLEKLNLTNASESNSMKELITSSLDKNILRIIDEYRKQIPILISLGLGVITQTLLSTGSFLSHVITLLLLKFLRHLKLITYKKKQFEASILIPTS